MAKKGISIASNPFNKEQRFLARKKARGLSNAIFGMPDLINQGINAGIRDVGHWAGYNPDEVYQLPMASQSAANLATELTGADLVDESEVSPEVAQRGANQEALMGMIPTGVDDLASAGKSAIFLGAGALAKNFPGTTLTSKPNKLLELYHGTKSPTMFDRPKGNLRDVGLHATADPGIADYYAGMTDDMSTLGPMGGRIYPVLADPGPNPFIADYGMTDPITWNDPALVADEMMSRVYGSEKDFEKYAEPQLKQLRAELSMGTPVDEALAKLGYSSLEYQHINEISGDYETPTAWLFPDSGQVVPRYSPEGILAAQHNPIEKSSYPPSFPGTDIIDIMGEEFDTFHDPQSIENVKKATHSGLDWQKQFLKRLGIM